MDSRKTKNIWIVIAIIALVAGAYYFGTSSKNPTGVANNTQETGTVNPTQETSVQQNQAFPNPEPKVTSIQNTYINFELSENPNYLFSKTFSPYKVKVYGVSLGDLESAIDPSTIEQTAGLLNAVYTTNHVTYTITNGKVSEITLNQNGINNNLSSEAQIIIKFGQPDRTETMGEAGFQHNYYYIDRGLVVTYFDTGSGLILVHIIGD